MLKCSTVFTACMLPTQPHHRQLTGAQEEMALEACELALGLALVTRNPRPQASAPISCAAVQATGAVSNIAMQPYGPYPGAAGYSEGQSAGTGSVPAAYPTGPQGPYGLSATPGPSHNPFGEACSQLLQQTSESHS